MLISCECLLLFTNMYLSCKHVSDGVCTWAKFDGHIYRRCSVILCKSISALLCIVKFIVVYTKNKLCTNM